MKNLYKEDLEKAINLLEEVRIFVNSVPNTSYNGENFRKSYDLASYMDKVLKQIKK